MDEQKEITMTTKTKKEKAPFKERAKKVFEAAKEKVSDTAVKVWEKRGWIGTGLLTAFIIWLKGYFSGWKDCDDAQDQRTDDRINALCRLRGEEGIGEDDFVAIDACVDVIHEWGADHVKRVMADPRFEDAMVDHLDD